MLQRVAARRRAQTLVERGPRDDGQANGRAERAIRTAEDQTRALKLDFEKRSGVALRTTSALFTWLVRHAVDVHNKLQPGLDGLTPFQRLRGRPFRGELLPFGVPVLHRLSGKMQGGVLTDRWLSGAWLGKTADSDEHLVALGNGNVIRARCVKEQDSAIPLELLGRVQPFGPSRVSGLHIETVPDGEETTPAFPPEGVGGSPRMLKARRWAWMQRSFPRLSPS